MEITKTMNAEEFLKSDGCPNIIEGFGLDKIKVGILCVVMEAYLQHRVNKITDEDIENENDQYKLSKPFRKGFITGIYWFKNKILKQ